MAKTRDANRIIDDVTGDDEELQQRIAEEGQVQPFFLLRCYEQQQYKFLKNNRNLFLNKNFLRR